MIASRNQMPDFSFLLDFGLYLPSLYTAPSPLFYIQRSVTEQPNSREDIR